MYRYRKEGLVAGVEKVFSPHIKGELKYELDFYDTRDVQPDIVLTDQDVGKLTISSLGSGIVYDTRDNVFDPRSGLVAGLNMKISPSRLSRTPSLSKAIFTGSIYQNSQVLRTRYVPAFWCSSGMGSAKILPLVERFFLAEEIRRGIRTGHTRATGHELQPDGGQCILPHQLRTPHFSQ